MVETDGDTEPSTEPRPSPGPDERPSPGPGQESLQVPTTKRRRIKSPTPGSIRGRSMTPIRGRSQTPFSLYLTRRSATPSAWRSITPFLKREDKEKTPFELGKDIKQQLFCNKAVFDKALVMDITEAEVEPVRYITTDMSVIDRAAVMDVSNVEVIYVVEEYEEYEEYTEEEERESSAAPEEVEKKKEKKKKTKKSKESKEDREKTPKKEVKKKGEKKDKREKSPSPKLSLKLEMGGGPKVSKKMFEKQAAAPPPAPEKAKPPPKKAKSKLAEELEKQAKAAQAAEDDKKKKETEKPKRETYEERQKRLKAEAEEKRRQEEEERKRQEEIERLQRMAAEEDEEGSEEEGSEEEGSGEDEEGDDRSVSALSVDESVSHRTDQDASEIPTPSAQENAEAAEERRGSGASEDIFVRPDPEEEEKWRKIAEEEGEEFMLRMRKFSREKAKSEKERDADWQKRREQGRRPMFINFLTDRASESGQLVRLACAVSGPDLTIRWYKDGKQVMPDPRHRMLNNNNILSLEILNTVIADSGEYACTISNSNDEVSSSCIVTIYEVFKDEPSPPTISLIRDFYHMHDDELTIECHIHGIPRPKVKWLKDAIEIKASFKYTLLEEAHGVYKLMIYRPALKDSGKYICRATNDSGEEEITHVVEFVKPKQSLANFLLKEKEEAAKRAMEEALKSKEESEMKRAPGERRIRQIDEPPVPPKNKLTFAAQLRDRIALEGANVKLMCNIIGPDPAVRWLKDDGPIPLGPKVKNLSTENKAILELIGVTAESSGVYKCIAKNQFSEIDTQCYLKVYNSQTEGDQQEPMFVLPMRDIYHSSENDLIIDTKVRGNPRPTITWLKDEIPVALDARVQQIEHLDGICELIINKPTQHDSGNYSCIAENNLGNQKLSHKVVVENIPVSRRSSASQASMAEEKPKKSEEGGAAAKDQKGKPPVKGKKKPEEASAEGGGGRRRQAEPEPSPKDKIYFIANLTNRYVAEGSKVKLQAAIGGPDPQIKWLKNGGNVPYGPRIKNLSRENFAILEIDKTSLDDSGEYSIVARNPANEVTTSAFLHVYEHKVSADIEPVFTRSIKETYHLNTNELILETHIRGQPTPTVTWYKDSVEVEKSEKYQIIDHPNGTCELIVDKPTNADNGKYLVKGESRAGTTEISHYVLFEGKAAKIAENIHGIFHADKTLLKSKEKAKDDTTDDGSDEKKTEEGEKKEEGDKKGKKGKGKGGKAEPESKETKETKPQKEEKREKKIGIHFGAKLTDRVVAEGSKVKLTCYVEGKDPQIRWLKDEQPLVYSSKVRQDYKEGLCTLQLLNVTESDSGVYKCYAKDVSGETTTICNVNVYANPGSADVPPTFTRAMKDTYDPKTNELILSCHIRGLPTPSVTWVKDGVRIEPSDKYQIIEHADGACELIVNDPITYDSGKYVCQAENRADKAEIIHMVHIEAKNLRQPSPSREIVTKTEEIPSTEGEVKESTEEKKEEKEKEGKKDEKKKEKGKKGGAAESSGGRRRGWEPPPDPKKKLHFGNFLTNRIVAEGTSVRMSVYINGPDPQVRWFRNDQQIVYGPKSKSACQDGLAILILSGLTEDDSGEYKIVARGPENEIESSCTLSVFKTKKAEGVSPVFTVGIKGRTLFIWCNVFVLRDVFIYPCR